MPRPPLWYLKAVELFEGVSEEQMHEIVAGVIDRTYDRKEYIYTAKDHVENVYILKEGEVTLYRAGTDGRRVVLDILKPGAVFGNIGFDPEAGEPHYAEVTQKAYICALPKNYFLQILARRPDIALRAFAVLNRRITQYEMQIRALSSLHARDRILATIRIINEKDDQSILPKVLRKPIKITHEKLGSMTGLSRETTTKQLNELHREGFVEIDHKNIRLTEAGQRAVMALV